VDSPRLKRLQEVLLRLAAGDYTAQIELLGDGDDIGAICVGVNLLAQELDHERSTRQRAEAALEQARAAQRAQEVQKMRSLAELSGGVAHDLNNLLSVMMMVSAAMRDPDPQDRSELLDDLESALQRGVSLAQQLLAVSVDTAQRLPVDPSQAVSSAVRLARRAAPAGVTVSSAVPLAMPRVAADAAELERVVLNLATNGLEAMPEGGRLDVVAVCEGGDIWVRVRDTGTGMSRAVLARATEPLFTTKPSGSGFGLALAYTLCQRAGGELVIDSATGRGTTVSLRLPVVSQK